MSDINILINKTLKSVNGASTNLDTISDLSPEKLFIEYMHMDSNVYSPNFGKILEKLSSIYTKKLSEDQQGLFHELVCTCRKLQTECLKNE